MKYNTAAMESQGNPAALAELNQLAQGGQPQGQPQSEQGGGESPTNPEQWNPAQSTAVDPMTGKRHWTDMFRQSPQAGLSPMSNGVRPTEDALSAFRSPQIAANLKKGIFR